MTKSIDELSNIATQIRRDIVRMVHAVNSGHPGGSLGCTEYFTALYGKSDELQVTIYYGRKRRRSFSFCPTDIFLLYIIVH